jgi:hypothetical protein
MFWKIAPVKAVVIAALAALAPASIALAQPSHNGRWAVAPFIGIGTGSETGREYRFGGTLERAVTERFGIRSSTSIWANTEVGCAALVTSSPCPRGWGWDLGAGGFLLLVPPAKTFVPYLAGELGLSDAQSVVMVGSALFGIDVWRHRPVALRIEGRYQQPFSNRESVLTVGRVGLRIKL